MLYTYYIRISANMLATLLQFVLAYHFHFDVIVRDVEEYNFGDNDIRIGVAIEIHRKAGEKVSYSLLRKLYSGIVDIMRKDILSTNRRYYQNNLTVYRYEKGTFHDTVYANYHAYVSDREKLIIVE